MKECPRCPACLDDREQVCPSDGSPLERPFPGEPVIDGTYRIEGRLGRGGMGVVYRARHLGLDRSFALKLIRFAYAPAVGGRSFAERFQLEARALGRLRHPGVVQVTDSGVDPRGLPYLVMEYLEGPTLWELARSQPRLPLETALGLLDGVAQAIDYGHQQGVLHRDVKSANVVATADGAKVLDFGLARLLEVGPQEAGPDRSASRAGSGELTEPGRLPGTPPYMAPELRDGRPETTACDVYSFGVLAYEVLCGELPARGPDGAGLLPPSRANTSLPPELDEPVLAALANDPARRPSRAGLVVAGLRAAWGRARRRRWRTHEVPRRLRLAALLAPAVAALAVVLGDQGAVRELERRTVDVRLAAQGRRSPDPRLLVVTVDEASLADPTPLADRGDEFGRRLELAYRAGVRGVAIDFLLPERWRHSREFSQLVLRRRQSLTLAAFFSSSGQIVGTECVGGLTAVALGADSTRELFGLVNVDEDDDGVARWARLFYPDDAGGRWSSWVLRAARALDETAGGREAAAGSDRVRLDPSLDWPRLRRVSWKDLPAQLDGDAQGVEGSLLLVGGDFAASGDDHHRIPGGLGGPPAVSGIVLHALAIDSLLRARPAHELSSTTALLVVGLASAVALAATLCPARTPSLAAAYVGANTIYVLGAAVAVHQAGLLLPLATPLLGGFLSLLVGLLLRLRLPSFPESPES